MVSQSEVYVFEADKMIQGFVGLNDEYIEGIFVSDEMTCYYEADSINVHISC